MRGGASTVAAALGIEGVADADGGRRSGPAEGFYDAPRAPAVRVMPAIDDVAPNSDTSPPPYAAGFDGGIALTRSELSAAAAELGAAMRAIVTPSSSHVETRSGRTGLPAAEDMLRPGSPPVIAFAMRNGVELVAGMLAAWSEGFAVAPLNPAYTAAEFDFYVKDLCPKLMLFAGAAKTSASKIEHERAGAAAATLDAARGPCNAADVPLAEVVLRDDWASLHPSTTGGASHITASGRRGKHAEEAASMSRLALRPLTPLPWLQPLHAFGSTGDARHRHRLARPSDAALMLHTSGTTGRPKQVPLSHANMVHSMRNIVDTYSIGPEDSTYLVMPLFHVHGLMAGLMAPLAARAAVALPAGGRFSAAAFWRDFDACSATWYTAVPTIHQILLARTRSAAATAAERGYMADAVSRIRFVRSCSSSLAPSVLAELESLCGSTVCEAYAMTEACHQMTSNPLAPRNARRPGTVGRATRLGVRVGVLDTLDPSAVAGSPVRMLAASTLAQAPPDLLPGDDATTAANESGEVCIQGATLFAGYVGPSASKANAESFTRAVWFGPAPTKDGAGGSVAVTHLQRQAAEGSWFRTGDIGSMSHDGFLTLEGRIKELINRGGEKISPLEVDSALLAMPAVAQAASFAGKDIKYGERVHAAVVLRPSERDTSVAAIQAHCRERLAAHKVPEVIHITDELPRTATGKIQRRMVAAHFARTGSHREDVQSKSLRGARASDSDSTPNQGQGASGEGAHGPSSVAERTSKAGTSGYELVARALAKGGVRMMFGVVGIPVTQLATAAQAEGIRFIGMRTEQAAGYAACASGFLSGVPAALLTVSGPGAVNALAGACHARANGMPLLVLSGACDTHEDGLGGFQQLDQLALMRPHCAIALRPHFRHPEGIAAAVDAAIKASLTGGVTNPGVPHAAYIDMPADLLMSRFPRPGSADDEPSSSGASTANRRDASDASIAAVEELVGRMHMVEATMARPADERVVREAAMLLRSSRRPVGASLSVA